MLMRAGTAKEIITPPVGIPMGGNARMDNYASGVMQDLYVRALYLEDEPMQLCLLSLDLLGMWQVDCDRLREAVSAELGIPFDHTTVCCTHTHSGPDTLQSLCWNDDKLSRDMELLRPFWETLPEKVTKAAVAAKANARACTMRWGTTQNDDIANNRRLRMKTGQTVMNWELPPQELVDRPLGPIDPQVAAILFISNHDEVLGGMVHYACHPAILAGANHEISGDFVGFAMAQLEQEFGCPAVLFLHGAAGNLNHIDYRYPERGRDASEVLRCAHSLVASVKEISEKLDQRGPELQSRGLLSVTNEEFLLPIRDIPQEQIAAATELLSQFDGHDLSMADGVPPELNARRVLKLWEAKQTGTYGGKFVTLRDGKIVVPLQVIRIVDVLLGMVPGEIFVEIGISFRQALETQLPTSRPGLRAPLAPQLALIVGLANGIVSYIPTAEAFEQGGYEPELGPSYLPQNAGNEIIDTLVWMANK